MESQPEASAQPQAAGALDTLQAFADVRGRPALFLFLREAIELKHAVAVRRALRDQTFDEIDVVLHSGGGEAGPAFQIARLLRARAKTVNVCVPLFAKSAATLLCLAADVIVLDELGQLGPLDTQVLEEVRGGESEYRSALNPFKALEQLLEFSMEALDLGMRTIITRSGMHIDECISHAVDFVGETTGPMFSQLSPERLGAYSRALEEGSTYGDRILQHRTTWTADQRAKVLEQLVYGYPSHDFVIDRGELDDLGFTTATFTSEESAAAEQTIRAFGDSSRLIRLVTPRPAEGEVPTHLAVGWSEGDEPNSVDSDQD